jgi:hypothetical protein
MQEDGNHLAVLKITDITSHTLSSLQASATCGSFPISMRLMYIHHTYIIHLCMFSRAPGGKMIIDGVVTLSEYNSCSKRGIMVRDLDLDLLPMGWNQYFIPHTQHSRVGDGAGNEHADSNLPHHEVMCLLLLRLAVALCDDW